MHPHTEGVSTNAKSLPSLHPGRHQRKEVNMSAGDEDSFRVMSLDLEGRTRIHWGWGVFQAKMEVPKHGGVKGRIKGIVGDQSFWQSEKR